MGDDWQLAATLIVLGLAFLAAVGALIAWLVRSNRTTARVEAEQEVEREGELAQEREEDARRRFRAVGDLADDERFLSDDDD